VPGWAWGIRSGEPATAAKHLFDSRPERSAGGPWSDGVME
jgi:hypothetical protein